jgi:transposase
MYVEFVPNSKYKPAILLRESKREGKKIIKKTILNITHWAPKHIDALKKALSGEKLVSVNDVFTIERSLPHGHVEAIMKAIMKLDFYRIISSKPAKEQKIIMALIIQRIIKPSSKLEATRLWKDSSIAKELGVENVDSNDVYKAKDWLVKRKKHIENKLIKKHIHNGDRVLYDSSSTYYYGKKCPLVFLGNSKDKKKGLPQIVYGLMTDSNGIPVSIDVYPGNTGDPSTIPDQVEKIRERFNVDRVILVGDRGMLTHARISEIKKNPNLGWISALRSDSIRALIESGNIQLSIFDELNLAEICSEDFPGERLVVCFNPCLAESRKYKREKLLTKTEELLEGIVRQVKKRTKTPLKKDEIGVKVGKVIGKYKMQKHINFTIEDNHFEWSRNEDSIEAEKKLDGFYIIRTSEPELAFSAPDLHRCYKDLREVEEAFRSMKTVDLNIQPINHRLVNRVIAHVFICFLAYYVTLHLKKAWAPLLYKDEDQEEAKKIRDPVLQTKLLLQTIASKNAMNKKKTHKTEEGFEAHSFKSLLNHLATRCKNICRSGRIKNSLPVEIYTEKTPLQRRALELLDTIVPS